MTNFRALVESGTAPLVTAELPSVDSGGVDAVRRQVERLTPWVDAVNVTDNTAAHAHASNVAVAIAVRQLGAEPIMQIVCRDKNRLAIQADIVGAALHGVENICCLTGDDVTAGDEPEARRVFDLDGPQLIRLAATLARGTYLSGRKLDPAPRLFIGAVENPGAPPYAYRAQRALKKVLTGARFLQLQICYHPDRLAAFVAEAVRIGVADRCAILPTICLTQGARALRFMHEELPGIDVPPEIISQVEAAADPREAAYRLALDQARHALALPGVRGLHLADFRHDDAVARLVTDLGIRTAQPSEQTRERHAHHPSVAV
jgi:methylenetetrahydrofolate reductase (NADPH)